MSSETNVYKVIQVTHYDEIELEIVVGFFESTEDDIDEMASKDVSAVLKEDGLHVVFGEDYFIYSDSENDKYQFRICTKELPPPIDVTTLSEGEIKQLIEDERYMTTAEDYQDVNWDLSHVYQKLKNELPHKHTFSFSSLAYGFEKVMAK